MYESELNHLVESADQLPADARRAFGELRSEITARTVHSWSEHCTECAAPACFQSCDLYEQRPRDGKCRRFIDGMVRIDVDEGLLPYVIKARFKRWGKLWSHGNTRLRSLEEADRIERRDLAIGKVWRNLPLHQLPVPHRLRQSIVSKRYADKKKFAGHPNPDGALPTHFVIECYNPQDETISLTLTMRPLEGEGGPRPAFQKLVEIGPGFHRERVPAAEIAAILDLRDEFRIDLIPNEVPDDTTLYFGLLEFVALAAEPPENKQQGGPKNCKCVVWDLDNTLWEGVLVEDGFEGLRLRPGVVETIRELDSRGVLHSVASKNDLDNAADALRRFGLDEFFLCPQVSWGPKSSAVRRIAERLNIGLDTLLFIDDQPFEREEVRSVVPEVRVVDAAEAATLGERPDCQGSSTADAARRRHMYREQLQRQQAATEFGADGYHDFLRECRIRLEIGPLTDDNLQRVHELAQRTNQLNFSGNRYNRDQLREIAENDHLDTFVLKCRDKFGDYGTVGFCVVDSRAPRLMDLAFSCRVQNKRVEHAFLTHLINEYADRSPEGFHANYRKTERNAPQARVFVDLGFEEVGVEAGITLLTCPPDARPGDEGIVSVVADLAAGEAV